MVGRGLLGDATSRVVLHGASLAGGLALMAEALAGVADPLAVAVPSFGWAEGRRLLASSGSAAEINRYLERRPEHAAEDLMVVLRYFDPVNFAGQVVCPTLVGVGLVDPVVPAPTVLAIADRLGGPVEVLRFPVSHSDGPRRTIGRRLSGAGWSWPAAGSRTASGADQPAQPARAAASRTQSWNQGPTRWLMKSSRVHSSPGSGR